MHPAPIEMTPAGFYCAAGDFYVDPWQPVERAVITHAHGDHVHRGCSRYLTSTPGSSVLRERVDPDAVIDCLDYGRTTTVNNAKVSLHPAGHILGSAQVRIEHGGRITVISGDYKTAGRDPTCTPFDPVRCHTFISEATFALPIYHWPDPDDEFAAINAWWRQNQQRGRTSVLFAYALGKAQRMLAGIDPAIGPIYVHGAVRRFLPIYERCGVALPTVVDGSPASRKAVKGRGLVIAPPSTNGTPWLRSFTPISTGVASGWMMIRGARRRRSVDRGFLISDHADWDGLLEAIRQTGAEHIGVTHGQTNTFARYLNEQGWNTSVYRTRFSDTEEDADAAPESTEGAPEE